LEAILSQLFFWPDYGDPASILTLVISNANAPFPPSGIALESRLIADWQMACGHYAIDDSCTRLRSETASNSIDKNGAP